MKITGTSETTELITPAGPVHEATVEHEGRYIVFSTHDCPFEEGLSIQLFGPEGQELERVNLYAAYTGGVFAIKDISDSCIEFTFWSEDRLRLTYHHKPKRVILPPLGVHYIKRFASHHLVVEGPFSQD